MLTFIKRTATSWQHDNGTVKSSFGGGIPVTNDTENTIVFQTPNGTNFPIKSVLITDCKIIDKTDGDAEYTFATTTEFWDKLEELNYPFINTGGGGGGGATNLGYTPSASNGIVTSSTGTDATIPLANGTNAGLSENNVTDSEKSFLLTAGGKDLAVYATASAVATAIGEALDSANTYTDNALENYTNTTDLNAALGLKEDKTDWVDISSSATIVGWSAYTTKIVKYKLENKMVVFFVNIEGTSNSQTTTLDLGMNVVEGMRFLTCSMNGGTREIGAGSITSGTSLIDFKRTLTGTAYSSTGNKAVNFTQHFETA